ERRQPVCGREPAGPGRPNGSPPRNRALLPAPQGPLSPNPNGRRPPHPRWGPGVPPRLFGGGVGPAPGFRSRAPRARGAGAAAGAGGAAAAGGLAAVPLADSVVLQPAAASAAITARAAGRRPRGAAAGEPHLSIMASARSRSPKANDQYAPYPKWPVKRRA